MHLIGIGAETAEDALVALAGHLPLGRPIGAPLVALRGEAESETVLLATYGASACVWFVSAGEAVRLVGLEGAEVEAVTYQAGKETDRVVRHERDMDLPWLP